MIALMLNFLSVACEIANPFLIKEMIEFMQDLDADISRGVIIAILYLIVNFLFNLSVEQATFYQMQLGVKAQTATRSLIYEKILLVNQATNKQFSEGDITNFMYVDSKQIINLVQRLPKIS